MSIITTATALLADIAVETDRTDAVQAFVKQETILVEITSTDGLRGAGLLLHDRDRWVLGPGAAPGPSAAPPRRRGRPQRRGAVATAVRLDALHHHRGHHLPGARRGGHRSVGPALQTGRGAPVAPGKRSSPRSARVRHGRRLAPPEPRRSGRVCAPCPAGRMGGGQDQGGQAARRRGRGADACRTRGRGSVVAHHDGRQSVADHLIRPPTCLRHRALHPVLAGGTHARPTTSAVMRSWHARQGFR